MGEAGILLNPPPVSFLRNIRVSDLIALVFQALQQCVPNAAAFLEPTKTPITCFLTPPSLLVVDLFHSRNGSSYATHSGGRQRAFQLNWDQCWTETEESAVCLSPGQNEFNAHASCIPPPHV